MLRSSPDRQLVGQGGAGAVAPRGADEISREAVAAEEETREAEPLRSHRGFGRVEAVAGLDLRGQRPCRGGRGQSDGWSSSRRQEEEWARECPSPRP